MLVFLSAGANKTNLTRRGKTVQKLVGLITRSQQMNTVSKLLDFAKMTRDAGLFRVCIPCHYYCID